MKFSSLFKRLAAGALSALLIVSDVAESLAFPPVSPRRVVFHIQDIHGNVQAQRDISANVQRLISSESVDLVALEGAFAPIDLSAFNNFPYPQAMRDAADYLLAQDKLPGPMHALVASSAKVAVAGVDDESAYRRNVAAYLAASPLVSEAKERLRAEGLRIAAAKARTFPAKLASFDRFVSAYRSGSVPLKDYVRDLRSRGAPSSRQTTLFLAALELEPGLKIEEIRRDPAAAIIRYAQYANLIKALAPAELLEETRAAEHFVFNALAATGAEKGLVRASRRHHLAGKLVDFALTSREWDEYKSLGAVFPVFETFYREAEARDEKMATNLLNASPRRAVLVTGGFHSAGIDRRLRAAGYEVKTITPAISRPGDVSTSDALSAFADKSTPLDRLFGENQFLSAEPFTARTHGLLSVLAVGWAYINGWVSVARLTRWLSATMRWTRVRIVGLGGRSLRIITGKNFEAITLRVPESLKSDKRFFIKTNPYIPLQAAELTLLLAPIWVLAVRHLTLIDLGALYFTSIVILLALKDRGPWEPAPSLAFAAPVAPALMPDIIVPSMVFSMNEANANGSSEAVREQLGIILGDEMALYFDRAGAATAKINEELGAPTKRSKSKLVGGVLCYVVKKRNGAFAWMCDDTDENVEKLAHHFGLERRPIRVGNNRAELLIRGKSSPESIRNTAEIILVAFGADLLGLNEDELRRKPEFYSLIHEFIAIRTLLLSPGKIIQNDMKLSAAGLLIPFERRLEARSLIGANIACQRTVPIMLKILEASDAPKFKELLAKGANFAPAFERISNGVPAVKKSDDKKTAGNEPDPAQFVPLVWSKVADVAYETRYAASQRVISVYDKVGKPENKKPGTTAEFSNGKKKFTLTALRHEKKSFGAFPSRNGSSFSRAPTSRSMPQNNWNFRRKGRRGRRPS